MNPDAQTLWRHSRWSLALLLACLGMLGPFSIDTYLPAFDGIMKSLGATPLQMQQTLSSYLFGFAVMNLFHGALSDSVGRRPVILFGMAAVQARSTVYTITTARVAMRIGAALTVTLNLPYRQIGNATLALKSNGTGTIALETLGDSRISYLVCWPHVRPWELARTQPALRCIPDAARVAKVLAEAAEMRLNEPVVARAEPGMARIAAA